MPHNHIYTAFLGWPDGSVEEVDFSASATATPLNIVAEAHAYVANDYEPGWSVIGVVDVSSNEVVYNPLNVPTTIEWWVTT